MAESSSEIVRKVEGGLLASLPKPEPHAVFVLSYGRDKLKTFNRMPPMADRMGSKYCYLVDTSEHHTRGLLDIPAMGDVYFFRLDYDATWQVTDAEAVVRRNIGDFDAIVDGYLRDALWRVGRTYPPHAVQAAEDEARRTLRPPFDLGGGLTVTWLSIRLVLDELQSGAAVEVDFDAHAGRLERTRVQRLRGLVDGDESYLLLHLAQHPDDTNTVLGMLAESRARTDQVRLQLLDRMIAEGFVQDADIGPLRDSILGSSNPMALPPGRPAPAVITPAQVQVVQPLTDPKNATLQPQDEVGAPSVPPSAPGNVTNWKPVRRGKSDRGPR